MQKVSGIQCKTQYMARRRKSEQHPGDTFRTGICRSMDQCSLFPSGKIFKFSHLVFFWWENWWALFRSGECSCLRGASSAAKVGARRPLRIYQAAFSLSRIFPPAKYLVGKSASAPPRNFPTSLPCCFRNFPTKFSHLGGKI